MLSSFVVAYLFLGGTGGGALVVLALLECANAKRRVKVARVNQGSFFAYSSFPDGAPAKDGRIARPRLVQRFRHLFALPEDVLRCGWVVCFVALALGIVLLFLDLGHPERVLNLLLHPHWSAITVGAYALFVSVLCALAFVALSFFDNLAVSRGAVYVLAGISVVAGGVVIAYTGILLTQAASVLFWMTPLLPIAFVLSSLSGGIACVMLGAAFAQTRQIFDKTLQGLGNIDTVIVILEIAILTVWLIWGNSTSGPDLSAQALLSGDLSLEFWLGLVGIGLVLPVFLEHYLSYGNHKTQTLMIAALVLFGGIMLRWCVVGCGSFDVTQTMDFSAWLSETILPSVSTGM